MIVVNSNNFENTNNYFLPTVRALNGQVGSGQPINPIRYFFSGRVGSGQPIDPT